VGGDGFSSSKGGVLLYYGGTLPSGTATVATSGSYAIYSGTSSDYLGDHVTNFGDTNGDGYDDFGLSAYGYDAGTTYSVGAVAIVYGSSTRLSGISTSLTAASALLVGGTSYGYFGTRTGPAGDVDGDGLADMVIGAYAEGSSYQGAAYLFYGDAVAMSGTVASSTYDGKLSGTASSEYVGRSVGTVGDVNGDGYDDFGVGATGVSSSTGAVYVVMGSGTRVAGTLTTSATFTGEASSDYFGYAISMLGDVDTDGYDSFVVGAYGNDSAGSSAGAVWVFDGPITNGTYAASTGHEIDGPYAAGDSYLGFQLPSKMADLTGDGIEDVAAGAFYDDSTAYDAGGVYIWGMGL
jgi:hypothetical protein